MTIIALVQYECIVKCTVTAWDITNNYRVYITVVHALCMILQRTRLTLKESTNKHIVIEYDVL